MKINTFPGARFVCADRLNNSANGNPRYFVRFETLDGERIGGKTATDSMAGYSVRNWERFGRATVRAHVTKAGRVIIDYITDFTEESAQ
jgi:hypothetical protein